MSWTSDVRQPQGGLTAIGLTVVLVSLAVAVVVPVLGNELLRHLILGAGPSGIDIRDVFFVTEGMVTVGVAAPVFAAVATRLPFVGVGIELLASVLVLVVERLRGFTVDTLLEVVVWLVVTALCLLGVDLVVRARRGRAFGLGWAVAGALAVAALVVVTDLLRLQVHGVRPDLLLRDLRTAVRILVETPLIIVLAGLVGWLVQRLVTPASGPLLVRGD